MSDLWGVELSRSSERHQKWLRICSLHQMAPCSAAARSTGSTCFSPSTPSRTGASRHSKNILLYTFQLSVSCVSRQPSVDLSWLCGGRTQTSVIRYRYAQNVLCMTRLRNNDGTDQQWQYHASKVEGAAPVLPGVAAPT